MSDPTGLYIRGRQVTISIEEALNILKTADHSTCIAVPPANVKDGDIYVYKPVDIGYSDSWKEDGHQWRIISSVHLPRRKPTILKRVYARILPDGKVDKELRKEVYCEDRGEDKHKLALLHFLGNFRNKESAAGEVEVVKDIAVHSTQPTDQVHQSETQVFITAGHDVLESASSELAFHLQLDNTKTDVSNVNVDIQSKGAVTDSNIEPVTSASGSVDFCRLESTKQAADSSTGSEELESAWKTLQMALGKKSGSKPVVEMVNKLMESVTSTEENAELDYCLVVSDKKSGKSSVIGTPEIAPRRSGRKRPTEKVEHESASDATDQDMNKDEAIFKKMFDEGGGPARGKLTPKLFIPSVAELGDQEVLTAKGDVVKFPQPCKETYFSYSVISDEERKIHSDFFDKKRASKTAERYLKIRNHMIGTWLQQQPRHVSKSQSRKGLKDCGDVTPMSRIHSYLECKGVINFNSVKSRPWMKKDKGTTSQSTFPEAKRRKVISTKEYKTTRNEDYGNDNDVGDLESDTDFDSTEETEVISTKGNGTMPVKRGISPRRTNEMNTPLSTKDENINPKQTAAATTRLDVPKRSSDKSDNMSVILSSNKKTSSVRVSDVKDVLGTSVITPINVNSDETIGVRYNECRTRNVATPISVVKDVIETLNVTPIKASSDETVGVRSSSRRTRNIATPNWADILSGRKSFKEDGGVLIHIKKEPIDNEYENSTVQGSIKEKMEEKSSKKKLNKSSVNAQIKVDTMIADDSDQSTSQEISSENAKSSGNMNKQKKRKSAQLDMGGMGSELKKVANADSIDRNAKGVTVITFNSKDSEIAEINEHKSLTDSETEYVSPGDGSAKRIAYKYACTECDRRFCVGYLLEEHMKNIHSKMVDGVEADNLDDHGVDDDIHMTEGDDDDDYADDVDVADDEGFDTEDDEDDKILSDHEFVPEIKETKVVKQAKKQTASVVKDGQKPKCNICGQVFLTEANLKRHSLLHTNKMYECPFCAKIMKRMDYVTQHVRKVHKDQDIHANPIDFNKFTHVIEPELDDNAEQQDFGKENNDESDDVKPPRTKVVTGLGKKVCPECSKLFDTQEDLEQHMVLVHKKELKDAAYTCQGCKKQFKTLVSYQVHKLSHRKKDHVCQHCGLTFVNNSQLQVHRRHDHQIQYGTLMYFGYLLNKGRLSCEICSADFDNMDEFHEHRPLHVVFNYMCKECGNGFMLEEDLDRHNSSACSYLNMHLPCGACDLQFAMYDTRRKHIMGNHPKETDFFCHHCGISFPNLQDLTKHFPMHKEEKIFVCEFCSKKFFEKRNLVDHRDLHRSSKNWQCHICDRFYISSKSLQRHIKLHLNRSLKNCKFCDSKFSTNEELEEHLISNHSEEDTNIYQTCRVCSRSFLDKSRLMKHMQIHNGDNTYTCDICNETLDANYLPPWKHLKKAHPEEAKRKVKRTFQCDECAFITEYKQRLERHMETHRKTKDFECDYCGRKYQTTSSLMTHMIIHRGKVKKGAKPEPICTWTNCNKRYIKHSLFKRHLISHIFKVKIGKDLCECGRCQYSTPQSGPTYFMQGESDYTAVGFVDEDGNPLVATKLESNQDQTNVINVHVLSSGGVEQSYESMDVLQEAIAQIEDIENKNSTVQGKPSQKGTESGTQVQSKGEAENAESDPSPIIVLESKDGKESIEETEEEMTNKAEDKKGMPQLQRMVEKATQETSTAVEGDSQTVGTGIAIEGTVGTGAAVEGTSVGTGTAVEGASHTMEAGTQSIVEEVEVSGLGTSSNGSSYLGYNYECGVCELIFQFKCNVVTHMEEDHPEHRFPHCPTCGKCIIDKKNLRDHMVIHEDTRGFSCSVCNKAFRTKQCLRQHSYVHAITKPFTCNFCGHGFTQKGFYFEHIRRHTGIKPFKCSVCSKAFVSKNLLRIHMFSHASTRPHKCEYCPKSFSENYQLVAHMRTHNDDRPFECSECDKAFFVRPKLIRHLNTVHGIDKEVLTNYVATRIGDGMGYRDKTKLQNQSTQNKSSQRTQVVYIDSHGNIVSQEVKDDIAVKIEQKQDVSLRRSVKIRPSAPFIVLKDPDTVSPEHNENDVVTQSFEVVTKRDEHGGVQVNAIMQSELNMTDPIVEMEQVVFQGADGSVELNGENYTLITQEDGQSDHIALIAQVDGVEAASIPDHCQGEIEVSEEQEVCDGELVEDAENLEVISEADLTQGVDGTENFSINIGEDGTVDAADFEKIEALRNMYSDQQIVIVLESQQQ